MSGQLTEQQERFAVEYAANGGNATRAAIEAGYSEHSAKDIGRRTLALPHVQEAIAYELQRCRTRSGAVGLCAMVQIATNEKLPAAARVSAARALMEHGGLIGSAKELADARDEAREALRDRGRVIDYREVLENIGKAKGAAA